MAGNRRARKANDGIEVLPPEPKEVTVRIDAAHLALIAANARRLQVDPLMPKIMRNLKKDAAYGLAASLVTLDSHEAWRAAPLLEEVEKRLLALGFQTKLVMKESEPGRWGSSPQPALHVVWGGAR